MQPIPQKAMAPAIIKKLEETRVVAVLEVQKLEHAEPLANALLKGGVDTIELTLRTDVALEAASLIKKNVPEITLGIGTVLTVDQVKAVTDIGADFAVAPGCNPRVVQAAIDHGLSFAPGITTASEIELAVELGCRILKFFPAESMGGLGYLKSMAGPYSYLGLKFIPLGGLTLENTQKYLDSPLTIAIGGSFIAKRDMILNQQWDLITENARQASEMTRKA